MDNREQSPQANPMQQTNVFSLEEGQYLDTDQVAKLAAQQTEAHNAASPYTRPHETNVFDYADGTNHTREFVVRKANQQVNGQAHGLTSMPKQPGELHIVKPPSQSHDDNLGINTHEILSNVLPERISNKAVILGSLRFIIDSLRERAGR